MRATVINGMVACRRDKRMRPLMQRTGNLRVIPLTVIYTCESMYFLPLAKQ